MNTRIPDYYKLISIDDGLYHFELKDFWSSKFIQELGPVFLEEFRSKVDSFEKKRFVVLADLSSFKTPGVEAKELIGKAMNYSLSNGLYKAVELIPMAIQRMGLNKAADEINQTNFRIVVTTMTEAMEQVKKMKEEIGSLQTVEI